MKKDDLFYSESDKEFERHIEANGGQLPRNIKGYVWLNCVCLVSTVALLVLFAPLSFGLLFLFGPFGGLLITSAVSPISRQAGESILLGCLIGFTYIFILVVAVGKI